MNVDNQKKNMKLLDYSDDSNNSIDFQPTARYIALSPNGISVEKVKPKNKKLLKKNTRISSNNDEDIEYPEGEKNFYNLNVQLTENIKTSYNNNEEFHNSDSNLIIAHHKKNNLYESCNSNYNIMNNYDINKSENKNINDYEQMSLNKRSLFSPNKKKKKIFLEEKKKSRGRRRSIFALEQKEEEKEKEVEEVKKYRKDINGTQICKKNKKKVKVGFTVPFVNVVPIESFKNYNIMIGMPRGEKFKRDDCLCCLIF